MSGTCSSTAEGCWSPACSPRARSPSPWPGAPRRRAPRSSSPASAAGCASPSGSPAACRRSPTCSSSTSTTPTSSRRSPPSSSAAGAASTACSTRSPSCPPTRSAGNFLTAPAESAEAAFRTSAFSLKALTAALLPLLERGRDAGVVGLDFDARVAWPAYDWAGVAKAALESVNRYLARDLGPRGVRANLVAAGPLQTVAAGNIEGFDGPRRGVGAPGAAGLGPRRPRARRRRVPVPALAAGAHGHRRDPPRRRRLPRPRRAAGAGVGERA